MAKPRGITATLPRDMDSAPIQVLGPTIGNQLSAVSGSSGSSVVPEASEVIRIAANGAIWLSFGESGVTAGSGVANSFLFPAGVELFKVPEGVTHYAARSIEGTVFVTATRMR